MKKIFLIIPLILFITLTSCGLRSLPDSATIGSREYVRSSLSALYPVDYPSSENEISLFGFSFYEYAVSPFDCLVAYDNEAEPTLYFATEKNEDAVSYYSDAGNYRYYCLFGNVQDENRQRIVEIAEVSHENFNCLIAFAAESSYNPFSAGSERNVITVPMPDIVNWTDNEIHFYKESKDDAFTTSRGYTFIINDEKLFLLYQYDFGSETAPTMKLIPVAQELSDYFISLARSLSS